jgi:hypothetical protein
MNLLMFDTHQDDPERMCEIDLGVIFKRESIVNHVVDNGADFVSERFHLIEARP